MNTTHQRSEGQKLVGFSADEKFITIIDEGAAKAGKHRSQFIREAVSEKLERLGIVVPPSLSSAPSRIGKGGPRKKTSPDLH